MSYRPSASLKSVASTLAELISNGSRDEKAIEQLLGQLAANENVTPAEEYREMTVAAADNTDIGIWQRIEEDEKIYYRRNVHKQLEWGLWASVHEIPPKGNKRRVLLFGESAARTVFYDPGFNLAMELENIFAGITDMADVEIIDLARTSMLMRDLLPLMKASVALEPDAVLVFAGNNWVFQLHEQGYDYRELLEIYQQQEMEGIKAFMEAEMKKIVIDGLSQINTTFVSQQIPVVFIIPEFNLVDWKSHELERILPALPDTRTAAWLAAREIAEQTDLQGNPAAFAAAAREMVAADPSNPYGYELLAAYYMSVHQLEEARKCLETARDTILFNRSSKSMPRRLKVIRETILSRARDYGITTLDMEEVFKTAYDGQLPDRRLFLDNCHLTLDGVKAVARHAAAALTRTLTGKDFQATDITAAGIIPGHEVLAHAHFGAAIYNMHYGQPQEIIRYHCARAYALFPEIRQIMMKYIDFSTRMASTLLCKSFEELIAEENLKQYMGGYTLRHPRNNKLMDVPLINAITAVLQENGIDIEPQVTALRVQEHAVGETKTDLLISCYSQNSYHNFFVKSKPAFFEARHTSSSFYFVGDGSRHLSFELVYRTRNNNGPVRIFVNGRETPAAELPATDTWTPCTFVVDQPLINKGLNELKISWPYTPQPLTIEGQMTADTFLNALFPAIGEISHLNVMNASLQ